MWLKGKIQNIAEHTFFLLPQFQGVKYLQILSRERRVLVAAVQCSYPYDLNDNIQVIVIKIQWPKSLGGVKFAINEIYMLHEIQQLRKISPQHKGIKHIVQPYTPPPVPINMSGYLSVCAMECVVGFDLFEIMNGLGTAVKYTFFQKCSLQIAQGIAFLHKHNIVHRDIKLDNIVIEMHSHRAVLIDVAFACYCNDDDLLDTHPGSLHYSAPELYMRWPYNGKRTDVYAFGVVLHCMLTCTYPFDESSQFQIDLLFSPPDLSWCHNIKLKRLLTMLLYKHSHSRPDIETVIEQLSAT